MYSVQPAISVTTLVTGLAGWNGRMQVGTSLSTVVPAWNRTFVQFRGSYTCQAFCVLVQSHVFSTIYLNGLTQPAKLASFKELLRLQSRGAILTGYMRNLTLLFCDRWFEADEPYNPENKVNGEGEVDVEEFEDVEEEPGTFCAITFISEHANALRTIHLGPFAAKHLDWHDTSQQVRGALFRLFKKAEEIVLEGIANIPLTLFRELRNLKSLDDSDIVTPGICPSLLDASCQIPSLTSLAMHTGSNGTARGVEMWPPDMSGLLLVMRRGIVDLSRLTRLYLHLLDSPGRSLLIKETLSSCADTLQDLRLYMWREDTCMLQSLRLLGGVAN